MPLPKQELIEIDNSQWFPLSDVDITSGNFQNVGPGAGKSSDKIGGDLMIVGNQDATMAVDATITHFILCEHGGAETFSSLAELFPGASPVPTRLHARAVSSQPARLSVSLA